MCCYISILYVPFLHILKLTLWRHGQHIIPVLAQVKVFGNLASNAYAHYVPPSIQLTTGNIQQQNMLVHMGKLGEETIVDLPFASEPKIWKFIVIFKNVYIIFSSFSKSVYVIKHVKLAQSYTATIEWGNPKSSGFSRQKRVRVKHTVKSCFCLCLKNELTDPDVGPYIKASQVVV